MRNPRQHKTRQPSTSSRTKAQKPQPDYQVRIEYGDGREDVFPFTLLSQAQREFAKHARLLPQRLRDEIVEEAHLELVAVLNQIEIRAEMPHES